MSVYIKVINILFTDQFEELRLLETQLFRLEAALKVRPHPLLRSTLIVVPIIREVRWSRPPSITLSESHALDSFDFLDTTVTGDDNKRYSQITEGM